MLYLKTAWRFCFYFFLMTVGLNFGALADICPAIQNGNEIQSQFQLLQRANGILSEQQEKKLKQLFELNEQGLVKVDCFFTKGSDLNLLSDILSILKLEILVLRYEANKKNHEKMEVILATLRKMAAAYLNQPTLMARRLGASVRSLLLDELELILPINPELVRRELRLGYWQADLPQNIETELISQWQAVKTQIPTSATPTSLARHFGYRAWRSVDAHQSPLMRLMAHFKNEQEDTLEKQLHSLFKTNINNLEFTETERNIRHYLVVSLSELKKNPYFLLKPWLAPVIDGKLQALKSELGVSWPLISPLVGVTLEGAFKEIDRPIDLLDSVRLAQARTHYSRVKNPLGRLYEIVFLKRLTQMWTQVDIVQLQSDLNRVAFMKTLMAVQDYKKRNSRWPASMDELISHKVLQESPKDYFTGKALLYDPQHRQIWSAGENGVDENGKGDDMSLRLNR